MYFRPKCARLTDAIWQAGLIKRCSADFLLNEVNNNRGIAATTTEGDSRGFWPCVIRVSRLIRVLLLQERDCYISSA